MKCPKCGYVSFDYNQVCPKCSKDIAGEQSKMNVLGFAPDTPFLLGALTGEANESSVGIQIGTDSGMMVPPEAAVKMQDSAAMESEGAPSDSQELDISLEPDALGEPEEPVETFSLEETETAAEIEASEEAELGDFEFELPTEEAAAEAAPEEPSVIADEGDITFDLGDLEAPSPEEPKAAAEESVVDEDMALDLGDLSLADEEPAAEPEAAVPESTAEAAPPEPAADGEEDLGLDLGDLSLDDSGEFDEDETRELPPDSEEIELDAAGAADSTVAADAGAEAPAPDQEGPAGLDIDDLILDEDQPSKETSPSGSANDDEVVLNLEDLKVNETGELEIGTDIPSADSVSEEVPLDLDDFSLDEPSPEKGGQGDASREDSAIDLDDAELDLEGLDLDLDLDEPEKK